MKTELYQTVTDKMIHAIETGGKPWVCPWDKSGEVTFPINHSSGEQYRGINILSLWIEQDTRGFSSARWMTYRQASAAGGQVRKGEKGSQIIFYKTRDKESDRINPTTGENEINKIPMLRSFTVFNLDQIDGIEQDLSHLPEQPTFDPIQAAENLLTASQVKIHETGTRAFYHPATDEITLPDRERFSTAYNFYATALHELGHATKKGNRCDRKPYASDNLKTQYAFEELVAEIGAVFAMAGLGITGELEEHADYLDGWLTLLKSDNRAIFKAAAQAQKSHEWIISQGIEEKAA